MKKLEEKDFIQEEYGKDPTPFWVWSFIVLLVSALIWLLMLWYSNVMDRAAEQNPFLQVSNRDFSLFLLQNPEHMRVHVTNKSGYLPGFRYVDKVGLDLASAENIVEAPPEVLFLYHTWHRLLGDVVFNRPLFFDQFTAFLNDAEEWKPENWSQAPLEYVALIQSGNYAGDLQELPLTTFPKEVRQALIGWLNYFKEGEQINQIRPTYAEIESFLLLHPQYQRSLWCQIKDGYLKGLYVKDIQEEVPLEELAPFLRAALFNIQYQK